MDFRGTSRPTNPGLPQLDDAADAARVPTLTLLRGGLPGRMYRIQRDRLRIGRPPDCEIQLDDGGISRVHAMVRIGSGDSIEIVDHGSTNGTFVNGRRVDGAPLRDGDKVQLGSVVVFRFNYQDAIDEAFQRQQFDSITRDALTGRHNRLYFDEAFRRELSYVRRKDSDLVVGLLDLDHFKVVNDTHGHAIGDQVLRLVAETIYAGLRPYDVLSRYGGEEFALLLRDTNLQEARIVGERLRLAVEQAKVVVDGAGVGASVSIGIAAAAECAGGDAGALLRMADVRLYAAKAAGRNVVALGQHDHEHPRETTVPIDVDEIRRRLTAADDLEASSIATAPAPLDVDAEVGPAVSVQTSRRRSDPRAMTLVDREIDVHFLDAIGGAASAKVVEKSTPPAIEKT